MIGLKNSDNKGQLKWRNHKKYKNPYLLKNLLYQHQLKILKNMKKRLKKRWKKIKKLDERKRRRN